MCHFSLTYQHFPHKYWPPLVQFFLFHDRRDSCLSFTQVTALFSFYFLSSLSFFCFLFPRIQLASLGLSNPNSGRDPALPVLPTVAPASEEPIFVLAKMVSTVLTVTPLTLPAPVSHPPLHRPKKSSAFLVLSQRRAPLMYSLNDQCQALTVAVLFEMANLQLRVNISNGNMIPGGAGNVVTC